MFRYVLVALLFLSVESTGQPLPQDEINDAIAHAQALYYEAMFRESIQLLTRIDEVLRPRTDRLQDKINVKLQMALSYIGLNDTAQAKSFLRQLYELDADYSLDAQQFSPKVISLAADAKAEQNEVRCRAVREDAQRQLASQNVMVLVDLIGSMKSRCSGLEEIEPGAAELLYKTGLESYKGGEFGDALQKFRAAVKFSPNHELATQYMDLTQNKLQVEADRLLLDWNKNFQAREYAQAAADYRQLVSLDDPGLTEKLNQVRGEYRKALSALVESANRACTSKDTAAMDTIRAQVSAMLPDPNIGEDIVAQMSTCARQGCIKMDAQLALTRLKTRVDPEIPSTYQSFIRSQVTVRVQARIDEKGDVTTGEAQGANIAITEAIRAAVARWKFNPILGQNGPRCVDTEFPVVINP
jgi:tetratricopeptide (TPR) repeat protein